MRMFSAYSADFADEAAGFYAQQRLDNQRRTQLMQHPDCRDPDHPGCEYCFDDSETLED